MRYYPLLLLLLLPVVLPAQPTEPILTLNTGMHTAMINRISTDVRGRYLLSVSDDKTAKLWSLPNGALLRTFRPPIGLNQEGKLYAGAISPDGRTVAVGGWTKAGSNVHNIYLFEATTGTLLRRLGGLPNVINDLEFSPDGRFLAAALGAGNGIRIFRSSDWGLQAQDSDYGTDSYNVAFDTWGRLASVCYDGYLRLYDTNFKLLKKVVTTGGKRPFSLAFSPDGHLLALGYNDSPTVQVLDGGTLELRYSPDISEANTLEKRLEMLVFSADGSRLAGGYGLSKPKNGVWWRQIRIWNEAGRRTYIDVDAGRNGIQDLKSLPDGSFVFGGSQPDWGLIHPASGQRSTYIDADLLNFRSREQTHFRLSAGGEEVGVASLGGEPLHFVVAQRQLITAASSAQSAATDRNGLRLSDWNGEYDPKLNGQTLTVLKEYERCESAAIATGGAGIALGASWTLYCTNANGAKQWEQSMPEVTWCVNIDPTNQVVAAALGDGTIRWYRFRDGQPLLTLYIHPDRQRWVLWTPSGYFDCAPGAEDLLGWHVNQGPDKEAAYYPLSRFRDRFYRPDVIDRVLEFYDEGVALEEADKARGRSGTASRATILDEKPPTVRLLAPTEGTEISSTSVTVAYMLQSPGNEAITAVRILVDGRPLSNTRGFKPLGKRIEETIEVPNRHCTVSVVAENRFGASEAAAVRLLWKGANATTSPGVDIRPKLYVLAIGVSTYQNAAITRLDYADDDARDFAAFFQKQKGSPSSLYADVQTRVLLDADASKDAVLDGLAWLEDETTSRDVAILFFAGHGVDDRNGNFFFLTANADPNKLKSTAVPHGDVQTTVASVAGKIVVFMDACHSGSLMRPIGTRRGDMLPEIAPVVNELISAENGAVVFCSTTNRQKALEDAKWKHGAFTLALLEGLGGKANSPGSKKITVKTLDAYVAERVKEMTGKQQTPTTAYPPNVPDFPVSYGQ